MDISKVEREFPYVMEFIRTEQALVIVTPAVQGILTFVHMVLHIPIICNPYPSPYSGKQKHTEHNYSYMTTKSRCVPTPKTPLITTST